MNNPTRPEIETLIRQLAPPLSPDLLIRQCGAESSFRQSAVSSCGAKGLFQLMDPTAKELCVDRDNWQDNVRGGILYMSKLNKQFGGNYAAALAAYNWGPGNVRRLLRTHPTDWRDHLPAETKAYLTKILG